MSCPPPDGIEKNPVPLADGALPCRKSVLRRSHAMRPRGEVRTETVGRQVGIAVVAGTRNQRATIQHLSPLQAERKSVKALYERPLPLTTTRSCRGGVKRRQHIAVAQDARTPLEGGPSGHYGRLSRRQLSTPLQKFANVFAGHGSVGARDINDASADRRSTPSPPVLPPRPPLPQS